MSEKMVKMEAVQPCFRNAILQEGTMIKSFIQAGLLSPLIVALFFISACSTDKYSGAPQPSGGANSQPVAAAARTGSDKQKTDAAEKPKQLVWQLPDGSGKSDSTILFDDTTDDGKILARVIGVGPCEAHIGDSPIDAVSIGKFAKLSGCVKAIQSMFEKEYHAQFFCQNCDLKFVRQHTLALDPELREYMDRLGIRRDQ